MSATRSALGQTLPRGQHGADAVDVAYEPGRAVAPRSCASGPASTRLSGDQAVVSRLAGGKPPKLRAALDSN